MPMLKPKTPASIMFTMNAGLSSVSKCSIRASRSNHHTSGANMMHALMLFRYVSLQWSLSTAGSTCTSTIAAVVKLGKQVVQYVNELKYLILLYLVSSDAVVAPNEVHSRILALMIWHKRTVTIACATPYTQQFATDVMRSAVQLCVKHSLVPILVRIAYHDRCLQQKKVRIAHTFLVKTAFKLTNRLLSTPKTLPLSEKFSSPCVPRKKPATTSAKQPFVRSVVEEPSMQAPSSTLNSSVRERATL
eukprot:9302-Heterococcus_DN1.PRE.1